MSNEFLKGLAVPVEPSTAVLTEFMRNGWTQNDIVRALSATPWKEDEGCEESPLEKYKGGVGYFFDWGHVIESHGDPFEDVSCFYSSWEFSLDGMLSKAHQVGFCLDDLCDLCIEFIGNLEMSSWPVFLADGSAMSSFCLMIQTTDDDPDRAKNEIAEARRWIANEFFEGVLPSLLLFLDNKLQGAKAFH